MSSINLYTHEITIKVVYYGPGLGGKTSSLQYIHRALRPDLRGQLVSLATGIDRTLYFDFLPVKLPKVKDFTIRMSLYTVPGQVHYNATRKLVLQGCDGVVLVADSQHARQDANIESLRNLEENLRGQGMNPETVPLVIQFNKRDLVKVMSVDMMESDLNQRGVPTFETCALSGQGIFNTLRTITKLVLTDLKHKGIYQGEPSRIPEPYRAPVVRPSVEERLVRHLEIQEEPILEQPVEKQIMPQTTVADLRFSELWTAGTSRDPILAIESDIERQDHESAVRRAAAWLNEYVGKTDDSTTTTEALLMLGVHGGHYARFRDIVAKEKTSRQDALFCLFFLTDIELRMRSVGLRIEE